MVRHLADLWHLPGERLAGLAGIAQHLGGVVVRCMPRCVGQNSGPIIPDLRLTQDGVVQARWWRTPHTPSPTWCPRCWTSSGAGCAHSVGAGQHATATASQAGSQFDQTHCRLTTKRGSELTEHACTRSSHVEGALEALAQEPGAASAKALGAAVHELGLGCLALKEVYSIIDMCCFHTHLNRTHVCASTA